MTNLGYMLHHLSATLDKQSDDALQEQLGIGFSQFKILLALRWRENVQQRHIAERLGQTEASISRQIRSLQGRGVVDIKINPSNRREHIVVLTPKGEKLTGKAMDVLNDYHAPVFSRLSPSEQAKLNDMLQDMHRAICLNDKPGGCQAVS